MPKKCNACCVEKRRQVCYNSDMRNDLEIQAVTDALLSLRAGALSEEYDLHRLIGQALEHAGLAFVHECPLAPRCRIDFLVGRVGIEVKKGNPQRKLLLRQLSRYLASDMLDAVVVVCPRTVALPERLQNKRVVVVSLNHLWGVALP